MESPYNLLYIYYLKGTLSYEDEKFFGPSFIGNWEDEGYSFLFFKEDSTEAVDDFLEARGHLDLVEKYEMTYSDWLGDVPAPFSAGNFFIHAPFHELKNKIDSNKDEIKIVLDPGVVFGSGRHPTTFNCLELVERVFTENKIETMTDIGTGTGLLAIAGSLLGCRKVIAVDYNFLATKTTLQNVRINNLDNVLVARGCGIAFTDYDADLIVANIHYDIMKDIVSHESFHRKRFFILSGIFKKQAEKVLECLDKIGANIIEHRVDSKWHTIYGENVIK